MDQELVEEQAKRHPKGASNSIYYTLLVQFIPRFRFPIGVG